MQDRVSLYPGRVKLTPVSGQENTYDMVRADEPTQEGDPLSKATFLKDATAALFGMDENAVPDDIFEYIYGLFPSDTSTIRIYVEDQYSRPLNAKVTISPTINNKSVFYTLSNGRLTLSVPEGKYTITLANSIFYTCTENTKSITVVNGTQSRVNFSVNSIASGKTYLESSGEMCVPPWIKPDLFAVGGGGSGATVQGNDMSVNGAASGGAGGYTKTVFKANINGETVTYTIGSGGSSIQASNSGIYNGNGGGSTSLMCRGETIISANGGSGGFAVNGSQNIKGASGGSGSGGVVNYNVGTAGSDGSNGGSNGGSGQGTTTREFGEPDGELYCGAGGSATKRSSGTGGAGGGGGAGHGFAGNARAGSGTKYGAGGGASGYCTNSAASNYSGGGYQGVLVIRWNEEGAV